MLNNGNIPSREVLEIAAIFDCGFEIDVIEAYSDVEVAEMITGWIESGYACA